MIEQFSNPLSASHKSYLKLKDLIREVYDKFGTKVYIDTQDEVGACWRDTNVYLHGDRHVINYIAMKMVVWQHNTLEKWESRIYVYPAKEL